MNDQRVRPDQVVAFIDKQYAHKPPELSPKLKYDSSCRRMPSDEAVIVRVRAANHIAAQSETSHLYDLLDTMPEGIYDDVALLAAQVCDTPLAAVVLIDEERLWAKAEIGLSGIKLAREASFCAHAILTPHDLTVVRDALEDMRFMDSPLVVDGPRIRFYAGAPLVSPDGTAFGTLCVADRVPRDLSPAQLEALAALSRQLMALLESKYRQAQLEEQRRVLQRSNARLARQSATDGLTGLLNRRSFEERLEAEVGRAKRYAAPLSLLMIDVDAFKNHNDAFGHPAGDEVLKRIAALLTRSVRRTDVVARYGGEEFTVIVPEGKLPSALRLAERCRRAIEQADWPHRGVTVSVGAATLDLDGWDGHALVEAADRALYKAKQFGRNLVVGTPDVRIGPEP